MEPTVVACRLPDHRDVARREDYWPLRLAALEDLVGVVHRLLTAEPVPAPTKLEDLSLRHLAKALGTTRSALRLMRDMCWTDACILIRAVFEQLFTYLWVVQDTAKAPVRHAMVTLKQEWANAKYLEGLALKAEPEAQVFLLQEAQAYRRVAESLLAELAAELGTTEKKVRDEATMRASLKAIEVNLGPAYSLPYAYYSGFVHSDGNALSAYGTQTPAGMVYGLPEGEPATLPLAGDLHRALLRLLSEVLRRSPHLDRPGVEATLQAHTDWLEAIDQAERRLDGQQDFRGLDLN